MANRKTRPVSVPASTKYEFDPSRFDDLFIGLEWQGGPDDVRHVASPEGHRRPSLLWAAVGKPGHHVFSTRGFEHTIDLLVLAATPRERAMVWVAGALHDFVRGYGSARGRFPAVFDLELQLYSRLPREWNERSRAIPHPFWLPEVCTLTVDDFVQMAALHRLATLARYVPEARWHEGAVGDVAEYRSAREEWRP